MKNQKVLSIQSGFILPIIIIISLLILAVVAYFFYPRSMQLLSVIPFQTKSSNKLDLKGKCIESGYEWLNEFNECQSTVLSSKFCQDNGGKIYSCESPCRHMQVEYCSEVCMVVCKFD